VDIKTKETLIEFFDDLTREELIDELIHVLHYDSVVDILNQMKEYKKDNK
jgi:hypothetical protein